MKKASIGEVYLTCNLKLATWNPFFGTGYEEKTFFGFIPIY
jgi:hypothetical protein